MKSENGQIESNLARALVQVEKAAADGAELVLLPEFLAAGYVFTEQLWEAGETREGPTVRWLTEHAARLGIYLGASFLEAEGNDFYNTFVLTNPDGAIDGMVRKEVPALFEACFTKGERSSHVIETGLGRVGVAICYDCELAFLPRRLREQQPAVDLILLPHSSPTPEANFLFPEKYVGPYNNDLRQKTTLYAQAFGVPVVLANKCGSWSSPLPGLSFLDQNSSFPGLSAVADGDGTLRGQLGPEEGVLVADVTLDASRKKDAPPRAYGRWVTPQGWPLALNRPVEFLCRCYYGLSRKRRRHARRVGENASSR